MTRGRPHNPPAAQCGHCRETFLKTNHRKRFCCTPCLARHNHQVSKGLEGHKDATAVCAHCGGAYVYRLGGYKHCSRECAAKSGSQNRNRKRRAAKRNAPRAHYTTADLEQRDGIECRHCGIETTTADHNAPTARSVDHIIPLSRGGHDALHNLQVLCRQCNTAKGNKISAADLKRAEELMPAGKRVEFSREPRPEDAFRKRASRRSKTGVNGVFYIKEKKGWAAQIEVNGKRLRRVFKDKQAAINCRKDFERLLGHATT